GLGLLFDTLVIRSFMTPSIAALMGRWFWWPQRVRTRPATARRPVVTDDTSPIPVGSSGETQS
ncbi:MAG: MMPL family transporter, partial [Mycobacteriaceae bacterium]|nr:MMPL family transporter [Mycobacteriaceae bacterium]